MRELRSPQRGVLVKPRTGFFAVACLIAAAGPLHASRDDFDDDPALNSDWQLYQPMGARGVTLEHEDSLFRAIFPSWIVLDHWTGVDNATQLRRADIPEEFVMETRVHFAGSGDPLNPMWPPAEEAYHAALMVYFSRFDVFQWGLYRGTELRLERSGINEMCVLDPSLRDVSLQVKKVGTVYSFSWRATDDLPWNFFCSQEAPQRPQFVGYIFKSWNPIITLQETFEFDYFALQDVREEAPGIAPLCPLGDPDVAWTGMPYARAIEVTGFPVATVAIKSGPPGLTYDSVLQILSGWTPESPGMVPIELEATNSAGTVSFSWRVKVDETSAVHDDEFDDYPEINTDYWELYLPQSGIGFSITEEADNSWWRLRVPRLGSFGMVFDHWGGVNRIDTAPQLRHPVPDENLLVETKVRYLPGTAPHPADPAIAGIMIYFDQFEILYWTVGQERIINATTINVLLEKSEIWNIAYGYVPDILSGVPVALRVEKRCDTYGFFYRGGLESQWTLATTYRLGSPPKYVGLIIKTWAEGAAFTVDFDYFTCLKLEGALPSEDCTNSADDDGDTMVDCQDEDCAAHLSCIGPRFLRGDPNDDGSANIADAVYILRFLFQVASAPTCSESADANDDGGVNITDAIYLLRYLFLGGLDPVSPGPAGRGLPCGPDREGSPQNLGCDSYTKC
jgi:hypothetical protein